MNEQQSIHERFRVNAVDHHEGLTVVTAEHYPAAGEKQGSHRPSYAELVLGFDEDIEIAPGDELAVNVFVYPPTVPRQEG